MTTPSAHNAGDALSLAPRGDVGIAGTALDDAIQELVDAGLASVTEASPAAVSTIEAMLRRHMAMYDWKKREMVAINDFILTARYGLAEDLEAILVPLYKANRDLPECITLLRTGIGGGWDHGDLSRAEELVERHAVVVTTESA